METHPKMILEQLESLWHTVLELTRAGHQPPSYHLPNVP